jgi:hypothetical protein
LRRKGKGREGKRGRKERENGKGARNGEKYFQAKLLDFHAKLFFTHGIGRSSR